jgi:ferredoxin-thioredoxin reductase catalytic subunit/rubredoxin
MSAESDKLYKKLKDDTEKGGYLLNPDLEFTMALVDGLVKNTERYGYQSCPCRLSEGSREKDRDLICPCDYRDADLSEYGACYCGLYVSKEIFDGKKKLTSIPERRNRKKTVHSEESKISDSLSYPVWRCRVCGYLCAREEPPAVCPICKVDKDRFERFM